MARRRGKLPKRIRRRLKKLNKRANAAMFVLGDYDPALGPARRMRPWRGGKRSKFFSEGFSLYRTCGFKFPRRQEIAQATQC